MHFIISRGPDWDVVYMSANEPQTLKDEYSQATKILDAEYKKVSASLDDVIKTCENLHVEEQHQLKELLQKYEHLFDGTLRYWEFNMEQIPISLQLMDPNCKPIHAHAYTVPRSVEQQLQHSKEIVRLVDIEVLEEDYSSEWASKSPSFAIPKKNGTIRVVTDSRKLNLLLKPIMSPIYYSKDLESWHDPFNGRVYLCFSIGLKYGLLSHQTWYLMLMLKSYVPLYSHGTWENTNTNAYPWVSRLPGSW
jgi:hypothetical protein